MENEKMKKHDELQSRREFFKKAAKGVLPILALSVFGTSLLSSCEKDDEEDGGSNSGNSGCSGCGNSCSGGCDDSCVSSCEVNCAYNCYDGAW